MTEESQNEPGAIDAIHAGQAADAMEARNSAPPAVPPQVAPDLAPGNSSHRWKRRVLFAAGVSVLLAAALVLPPLVNIGRYQRQVTALMTRSMGRPVHMSGVELRLLPSPGFILHDLSVGEDPAFGAEPILSARTVVASVRLFSLWRGRLEIREVSVDEASLNLVRSPEGRWNLESLLMGAQPASQQPAGQGGAATAAGASAKISAHFPYLSATNSRVNFKNGVEKTPFSLAGTDLSFWQDNPGQWRVRLLGQPVRTDLPMSLADTGEVRMEASLQSASQLREMPMKLQMEWREAQLGQLSRLILGSDAGWRGDLTADIEMQGTLESAQTKARLRATGVRRQEFVPEISLDFDANCAFRYQHSQVAFHDIGCDTAIGDGRLHLKAELPGQSSGQAPEAMLEVHQVPLQAALDLLRTVRSGFAPGILARGTTNGSLRYKETEQSKAPLPPMLKASTVRVKKAAGKLPADLSSSLQGNLKITDAELSGGTLKAPLKLPEMTLTPAVIHQVALVGGAGPAASSSGKASMQKSAPASAVIQNRTKLVALFTVPLASAAASSGSPEQPNASDTPVPAAPQIASVQILLDQHGYQAQITGAASIERLRELASGFGWNSSPAAEGFHGGTADFSFASQGAWIADANGDLSLQEGDDAQSLAPALSPLADQPRIAQPALVQPGIAQPRIAQPRIVQSGIDRSGIVQPGIGQPVPSTPKTELTLHHTQWQTSYLANPVRFAQATVHQSGSVLQFAGDFTYGPGNPPGQTISGSASPRDGVKDPARELVHGTANLSMNTDCAIPDTAVGQLGQGSDSAATDAANTCLPRVELHFGALDAAVVEAASEAAPAKRSVFAPLTDRMRSTDPAKLPEVLVSVQADSLLLGPVTLQKPAMHLHSLGSEIKIVDWEAQLLGGSAKGTGHIGWDEGKPVYELFADFDQLNGTEAGALLAGQSLAGQSLPEPDGRWSGGAIDGGGKVTLSGLIPKDLAASAAGDLRFDWRRGSVAAAGDLAPGDLHFERWVGVATIGSGQIHIDKNNIISGKRRFTAEASIPFGGPAKLTLKPVKNPDQEPERKPVTQDANAKPASAKTNP